MHKTLCLTLKHQLIIKNILVQLANHEASDKSLYSVFYFHSLKGILFPNAVKNTIVPLRIATL